MIEDARVLIAALYACGAVVLFGCGGDGCAELADAFSSCAGPSEAASQSDPSESQCTDAEDAAAQCYIDFVVDVCAPTDEELAKVADCVANG